MMVAGGGGGYGQTLEERTYYPGGAVGADGQGGAWAGEGGSDLYPGDGGRARTAATGCTAAGNGAKGADGVGGAGGNGAASSYGFGGGGGGGGGGGYRGGGGAAGSECYGLGGGGGGGGSSYGPVYMKHAAINQGDGAVAISYGPNVAILPRTPKVTSVSPLPASFDATDPVRVNFKVNSNATVEAKVFKLVDGKPVRLFLYEAIHAQKGSNTADITRVQKLPTDVPLFVRLTPFTTKQPAIEGTPVDTETFIVRGDSVQARRPHHGKKKKHRH